MVSVDVIKICETELPRASLGNDRVFIFLVTEDLQRRTQGKEKEQNNASLCNRNQRKFNSMKLKSVQYKKS